MAVCLIGLGSNIGDRTAYLRDAVRLLGKLPETQLLRISSAASTPPAGGPTEQGAYLNAAALIETSLAPKFLLDQLQRMEGELGRERVVRWGARTIDLDLLLYDNLEIEDAKLTLPHPRMAFRRFVLEPAAEIAPDIIYPINGWTIARLRDHIGNPNRQIALAPCVTANCQVSDATELLASLANVPNVHSCFRGRETTAAPFPGQWVVSDEWRMQEFFEQLEASLDGDKAAVEFIERFVEQPPPKLVVVWTPEIAGFCHARSAALEFLDLARHSSGCGPVLWIPGVPLEQARSEVIAAMVAME
jgi:2-amino-4-hydroxy-6-hydroxymethyldihydropteridine diphosphokinase